MSELSEQELEDFNRRQAKIYRAEDKRLRRSPFRGRIGCVTIIAMLAIGAIIVSFI